MLITKISEIREDNMTEEKTLNKELVTILKTFDAKDYARLRDFMNSPFYTNQISFRQSPTQLMALLYYFENKHKEGDFLRQEVLNSLFPCKKDEKADSNLDKITSGFLAIVKEYIFWTRQEKEKNDFEECFTFAKFYFEKELYVLIIGFTI